jgi:hypothetical protein
MNPLARPVTLGGAGLLLAALFAAVLFAAATPTNEDPLVILRPSVAGSTNLALASLSARPMEYLDRQPEASQPLKPGVYQTRPDAIILIVPKRGLDDRSVVELGGVGSKMPVVKPELRAVPISPAK